MSEWDDTPWAGTSVSPPAITRLPWDIKAVTGAGVSAFLNDPPLSSLRQMDDPQAKAKAFLQAYKCGWFYKAESKISGDIARLPWTVSDGDVESDDPEESNIPQPDLDIPFETLNPIDQFMRLMERPNPQQTGRMLRQKTHIRRDMAGWTFWYLEAASPLSPITAIYGISPSRLWPSYDKRSGQLLGWILDYDKQGGTMTFEPWEIVTFSNASADDDNTYGVGVVEAVYAELPLTDLMSKHTADLLSTGGRLAGMMWPRERALDEDEFNDAQRAWRNVVSDANSAKRMLLFPEPMEYASGASTPAEIGIPELAELNRDNILTAFPIAPEVLGVSMPAGQNASGETRRELYDWYWRGTIEPRSDSFDEVIQVNIISRYEALMGQTFNFETNLPDLDDASSLLEKAGAFKSLVSIGFDPKAAIKALDLDHIKWTGLPALLDPRKQAEMAAAAAAAKPPENNGPSASVRDDTADSSSVSQVVAKATKARNDVVESNDPDLRRFFELQSERIIDGIRAAWPRGAATKSNIIRRDWAIKADPDWWNQKREDDLLREVLGKLYVQAARGSLQVVADTLDLIVPNRAVGRVVQDLVDYGGERITGINGHTLEAVQASLAEGTRRGYGLDQIIDGVPDEGYNGIKALPEFDDARAETVARTETMLSYNRAALDAYGEFGVERVLAYDGDYDPECAARDGQTFTVEEAMAIEDHPNGTLDWAPVTDKAYHGERIVVNNYIGDAMKAQTPSEVHVHVPEIKVPEVHADMDPLIAAIQDAARPEVDLEPIVKGLSDLLAKDVVVNVPPPQVKVVERSGPQDVRIVDDITPPKTKRVIRGQPTRQYPLGPVTGVTEER